METTQTQIRGLGSYLLALFLTPIYCLIRGKYLGFVLSTILYILAFLTFMVFGLGFIFWALAAIPAAFSLRNEIIEAHASRTGEATAHALEAVSIGSANQTSSVASAAKLRSPVANERHEPPRLDQNYRKNLPDDKNYKSFIRYSVCTVFLITVIVLNVYMYKTKKDSISLSSKARITTIGKDEIPVNSVNKVASLIPAYVDSEHKAILQSWLSQHPKFRIATDADYPRKEDLPEIKRYYDNNQLYYAIGDFNGDGRTDFAIVLIDTSKNPDTAVKVTAQHANGTADYVFDTNQGWNTAVAVFNGPLQTGMKPAFLAETVGTPVGSVLFYKAQPLALMVGKWENEARLLLPKGNGYRWQ